MLEAVESRIGATDELPVWIERLLKVGWYSCSEPQYVQYRQGLLREWVLEAVEGHVNGRNELRDACVRHLTDSDETVVKNALSCLFVVGTSVDVPAVEPILDHSTEKVRKAARTCIFEMRRQPADINPM